MEDRPLHPKVRPLQDAPPISFPDAIALVQAQSATVLSALGPAQEPCELAQALGRVLAADIAATRDQPPFPRVARDGFAVRSQDIAAGRPLRVTGELRAGEPWLAERPVVGTGEAVEIMTGAALPPGADAVLMVEHAEEISASGSAVENGSQRSIRPRAGRSVVAGENVVPQGSEARRGEALLPAGVRLRPEEIALVAACGLQSVPVYPVARVAVLATGDELAEASEAVLSPHRIYDSNSHALAALVRQAHGVPLRQPAVRDRKQDLEAAIRAALANASLLLISGGVSMGRYDLVEEVLAALGADFFFTGVRMQPGKPVVFGQIPASRDFAARYFFGLPGNPVSAMVTFRLFVRPLLAAFSGERNWQPQMALALLASELRGKPGLTRFVPAHLDTAQSMPLAAPLRSQGSGDLAAYAQANCCIVVPEHCDLLAARQPVRVLLL